MEIYCSSYWRDALVDEYCGMCRNAQANSGLDCILKSAFRGVDKMLVGKKFPMNVRALSFVVLELLRGQLDNI